jgi:hypothetical protein
MTWKWSEIAPYAFGKYLELGRGAVLVSENFQYVEYGGVDEQFDCCSERVDLKVAIGNYDPMLEVVVANAANGRVLQSQRVRGLSIFRPPVQYSLSVGAPSEGWSTEMLHQMRFKWGKRRSRRASG